MPPRLLKKICGFCGRDVELLTSVGAQVFCLHCGRTFKVVAEDFAGGPPSRPPGGGGGSGKSGMYPSPSVSGAPVAASPSGSGALRALASGADTIVDQPSAIPGAEFAPDGTPVRLGEFRILRELGRGGMGAVYEAEQTTLRRRVAVKVLPASLAATPSGRERFRREAEAVARLDHPGIIKVFAIGEEQGTPYFAMELIDGRNLDDVLRHEKISFERAATLVRDAALALSYAHGHGVIHRDVKPANLMVTPAARVLVSDFGLARVEGSAALTVAGATFGTPSYMAPEQAAGRTDQVDHRTDVYGLGATLYELTTGKRPFDGPSAEVVIHCVQSADPTAPRRINPRIPVDLETICLRALEKEPGRRYAEAADLAEDLTRFIHGEPIQAKRIGWAGTAVRAVRRNRALSAVAAAGVAAVAMTLAWSASARSAREEADRRATAEYVAEARKKLTEADGLRGQAQQLRSEAQQAAPAQRAAAEGKARRAIEEIGARARDATTTAWSLTQRALGKRPDDAAAHRAQLESLLSFAQIEADLEKYDGAAAYLNVLGRLDVGSALGQAAEELQTRVDGRGWLSVASIPGGARVTLAAWQPDTMSWGEAQPLGTTPTAQFPVDMGSRLLVLELEGYAPARVPFVVPRNGAIHLATPLLPAADAPPEMIYVAVGDYLGGNPEEWLYPRAVEGFLIDRCETTCGEYKRFLDTLDTAGKMLRMPFGGKELGTHLMWFAPKLPSGIEEQPLRGISWEDAQAYARWAKKRLPYAAEWEKAARGADGRVFAWGDRFEAGRAACADSPAPGKAGFYRVHEPAAGASPYGCLNMSGNVAEYVEERFGQNQAVMAGGSWQHGKGFIRTFDMFKGPAGEKTSWAGLRCARDVPAR
ncbi:MAG: protein kinase [Planctomycetes bacterium]|nr:protein kinase [Planctomycetota bacterium]